MRTRFQSLASIGSVLAAAVFLSPSARGADDIVASLLIDRGEASVPGVRLVELDRAGAQRLRGLTNAAILDVPTPTGESVILELERREVFTHNAQVIEGNATGQHPMARPDITFFGGTLAGDPSSLVFVAVTDDRIEGFVRTDTHQWVLSSGPIGGDQSIVIYDPAMLPEGVISMPDVRCGSDELARRMPLRRSAGGGGGGGTRAACRVALIAIDTDFEYTRDTFGGNAADATAYAATLIAGVSEIYKREFNTSMSVSFVRVWTSDNDPYSGGSSYDRIFQLQDHWNANMQSIDRNAVHLLSALRDGSIGGVAYYPGLCQYEYDYGLSAYLDGFFPHPLIDHSHDNWDIFVCGHELGHNFGAPHSHDTSPPIDGCGAGDCSQAFGGSIMSYCHGCSGGMSNIKLTMHPRMVAEHILPYLNDEAPCDLSGIPPTILQDPTDVYADAGESAAFSVNAYADGAMTYQWYHDDIAIYGAIETTMSLDFVTSVDAGLYRCEVTSGCATASSAAASLFVEGSCLSDYDGDGFVTGDDFDAFVAVFEEGDDAADANGDGFVTGDDFDLFVLAFELGC